MHSEKTIARNGSASGRVLCRSLCAGVLFAVLPQSAGHAQSAAQLNMSSPADWNLIPEAKKKTQLYTYYGGIIPKDGYVIVPTKPGGQNFLQCDTSLILVDEKILKNSQYPDCNMGRGDPGILKAYIKAVTADGDYTVVTQFGSETITKSKWNQLLTADSLKNGTGDGFTDLTVGDFAAFEKNDKGTYATIFKLAPSTAAGGGS
jgi:hypothetical protein